MCSLHQSWRGHPCLAMYIYIHVHTALHREYSPTQSHTMPLLLSTVLYSGTNPANSHCYHRLFIIPFKFAMRCHLYTVRSTLHTPARWRHTLIYSIPAKSIVQAVRSTSTASLHYPSATSTPYIHNFFPLPRTTEYVLCSKQNKTNQLRPRP